MNKQAREFVRNVVEAALLSFSDEIDKYNPMKEGYSNPDVIAAISSNIIINLINFCIRDGADINWVVDETNGILDKINFTSRDAIFSLRNERSKEVH